jgi:hypothetical protein
METPVHTRTIDKIQITNDYQDTGVITLTSTNCRRLLRTWRIEAGRDAIGRARLRDTHEIVKLVFVNDERHHNIVLHDLVSLYMVPAESIANKSTK